MGYELRMSGEIHDWLAELRDRDPVAAHAAGRALLALIVEGDSLGPPLVRPVSLSARPDELEIIADFGTERVRLR